MFTLILSLILSFMAISLSILAMFYAKYCTNKIKNLLAMPKAYFDMYDDKFWRD